MGSESKSSGTNRRRCLQLSAALVGVSSAGCIESFSGGSDDEPETDTPEGDNPDDSDGANPDELNGSPINAMVDAAVSDEEVTLTVVESGAASHFVLQGEIEGVETYTNGAEILDGGTGATWSSSLSGSGEVSVLAVAADDDGREQAGSFTY